MGTSTGKDKNRYPGLRPFVKDESAVFFGRNVEIEQLIDSIKVNKSFILFGKSGLGKSSLVSAGVLPRLVAQSIFPIIIRFYNSSDAGGSKKIKNDDPLSNITKEVKAHIDEKALSLFPDAKHATDLPLLLSLWTKPETPLLIFDQFEEFFYFDKDKRELALQQIAAIANNDVYSHHALRDMVKQEGSGSFYEKKIPVKLLFLIRSDRLNLMDEVFEKIPGIFNNRFNLKPLLKEKAEQSVILPAQIKSPDGSKEGYKTLPYLYDRNAVTVILDTLSNKDGEIESSQLQIVCQELEQIAELKWKDKPAEVIITEEDFNGQPGIKEILNRFYWKQLDKLRHDPELNFSEKEIKTIRYLIENELVSDKKRIIQSENRVREIIRNINPDLSPGEDSEKMVDAIIGKLLDLRLIREEDSHLGKVYEISHDTLLESIIKSRDERMKSEREDKIKEQEELLAQEKQKSEQERKLKEKAREEREKAKEAERNALSAKREAEQAWSLALDEEKKANRARKRLRWSFVALFIIGGIFTGILLWIVKNSNDQKVKYKHLSGKVILFNALTAYDNGNHAMAFNLASEAGRRFDRKDGLLDSLVKVWSLEEYSGDTQMSDNRAFMACRYENKILQIFAMRDPVRKNNPRGIIDSVDYFKFSPDGTKLVAIDEVNKRYRFYALDVKDTTIHAKKLWETRIDTATDIFITNDLAAIFRKENILEVRTINAPHSVRIKDVNPGAMENFKLMSDKGKIYIGDIVSGYNDDDHKPYRADKFIEVDLSTNIASRKPGIRFMDNSMNAIYIFDQASKSIDKIQNGSRIKIIDMNNTVYYPGELIESKSRYILSATDANSKRIYFLINKSDLATQPAVISKSKPYNLGNLVQYSEDEPMFMRKDTLTILKQDGQVRKFKVSFSCISPREGRRGAWYEFSLSADRSKLYFKNYFFSGECGYIPISDTTNEWKALCFLKARNNYADMRRRDILFSSKKTMAMDSLKHGVRYWENFYEPLSERDKNNYGIERIK